MEQSTAAHDVLMEATNFHHILKHIDTEDLISCMQVCKSWNSFIHSSCSFHSSISITSACGIRRQNQMKQKISSFVSQHSKKKHNFHMTIKSTALHVKSPLVLQLIPNFASSLYKLQMNLSDAVFTGFENEVLLRNLLASLKSLVELEMDLPVYACMSSRFVLEIRSTFDVVLTPPFVMPSLRKLIWREPLYLHKSDYLPVAFPSLTICVISLVNISDFIGAPCFHSSEFRADIPNPPYPTSGNPLSITWPSIKRLTVEGYEEQQSKFLWLSHISPQTKISHVSLLNVQFCKTIEGSFLLSTFFPTHSRHFTELTLSRPEGYDIFRSLNSVFPQDLLEHCDFPQLLKLDCDITFLGNVSTALRKMPLLQKFYLGTSNPQPIQSNCNHDISESCAYCVHLWKKIHPVENNVKLLVLRGNYCIKSLLHFSRIFYNLRSLEIEEQVGNRHIICKLFSHIKFIKLF